MYSILSQLDRDGNFSQVPLICLRMLPLSVNDMFAVVNSMASSLSL